MAPGAGDLPVLSVDGPHVPEIQMDLVKERWLLLHEQAARSGEMAQQ